MHSGTLDKTDSPKKRILSRGMSEEESLRHIIQEVEQTPTRLSRSDRHGSLRRGGTKDSQSEEEHAVTNMTELQANYEDCLQELQTLELKQEVVLFQMDCLQDAVLEAEEMLAEAQREAHEIRTELERERERRSKLEEMVDSLRQEVDRLKEEKHSAVLDLVKTEAKMNSGETVVPGDNPVGPAGNPVGPGGNHVGPGSNPVGPGGNPVVEIVRDVPQGTSLSPVSSDAGSQSPAIPDGSAGFSPRRLASFFKNLKVDSSSFSYTGSIQGAPEGTSVDEDVIEPEQRSEVESLGHVSQQAGLESGGDQQAQDGEENDESSGYEDARSEFPPGSSTPDGLLEADFLEHAINFEETELKNNNDSNSPKGQDSCMLS